MDGNKVRLSFRVKPELKRRLEALQPATDSDNTHEVLRKAITVLEMVTIAWADGHQLVIRSDDSETVLRLM